jgi:hypothetical protein
MRSWNSRENENDGVQACIGSARLPRLILIKREACRPVRVPLAQAAAKDALLPSKSTMRHESAVLRVVKASGAQAEKGLKQIRGR